MGSGSPAPAFQLLAFRYARVDDRQFLAALGSRQMVYRVADRRRVRPCAKLRLLYDVLKRVQGWVNSIQFADGKYTCRIPARACGHSSAH